MQSLCLVVFLVLLGHSMNVVMGYKGAKMDELSECDNAQSSPHDWNGDFRQFTCEGATLPVLDVQSRHYQIPNLDPRKDIVWHVCTNKSISYEDKPPLRGDHRPNWAKFGEYLYLPPQRWLHNLEHGTIVMLYHPCVNQTQLNRLRVLVTSCLYRHIITPYNELPSDYPLTLVSWGAKLQMNTVQAKEVVNFIRQHGRTAPEDLSKQGQYDHFLLRAAAVLPNSDIDDNNLCPSVTSRARRSG